MAAIGLAGLVIGTVDAVFVRNMSALRRLQDRWMDSRPDIGQLSSSFFENCAGFGFKLGFLQKRMATRISVIDEES